MQKVGGSFDSSLYEDITELRWYHTVPVVNVFYDVFFDAPPTIDQLKELLNLIALVSSLIFSVIAGLLFSYSFDDYEQAIARFTVTDDDKYKGYGELGKIWGANDPGHEGYADPYMFSIRAIIDATVFLTTSIVLVLVVYFALGCTSFVGPDNELSVEMIYAWWMFVKIPVAAAIFFMIAGIIQTFYASNNLVSLMLPDMTIANNGDAPDFSFDRKSPYGYANGQTMVYVIGGAFGALMVCGVSLTLKNRKFLELSQDKKQRPDSEMAKILSQVCVGSSSVRGFASSKRSNRAAAEGSDNEAARAYLKAFEEHSIEPRHLASITVDQLVQHLHIPLGTAIDLKAVFAKQQQQQQRGASDEIVEVQYERSAQEA
jgi:hypothetical protein